MGNNKHKPTPEQRAAAEMTRRVTEAAMTIVQSKGFVSNLARAMIREAAENPGGYNYAQPGDLLMRQVLVEPVVLQDDSAFIITQFPINLPTSYVLQVFVTPKAHDHDHGDHDHDHDAGPTEQGLAVGEALDGPTEADGEGPEVEIPSFILYKDHPGDAARNHLVLPLDWEGEEIVRQLKELNPEHTQFLYISKLMNYTKGGYFRG